ERHGVRQEGRPSTHRVPEQLDGLGVAAQLEGGRAGDPARVGRRRRARQQRLQGRRDVLPAASADRLERLPDERLGLRVERRGVGGRRRGVDGGRRRVVAATGGGQREQ